jgi:hypothetical protein
MAMRVVGKTIVERRRDRRPKLPPITLVVDCRTYVTEEWTLGGFLVGSYIDSHRVGDTIAVQIRIDAGGGQSYEHYADAQVARVDKERLQLAARFIELDAGAIETLEGLLTGRLRRRANKAAKKKRPAQTAPR